MIGRLRAASLCAMVAMSVAASPLLAAPAPDQRRTVAGWRVEASREEDGGRLVRMVRRGRGWRFEYHLAFWYGHGGGIMIGASFRNGRCSSGEADMLQEPEAAMSRENFEALLQSYLRECPLSEVEAAAFRRGLDAAWPLFAAWAREAQAATLAEAAEIER
jgi:hypothetical protein